MEKRSLIRHMFCLAAAVAVIAGCKKEDPEDQQQGKPGPDVDTESFEITLKNESEFWQVEYPSTGKAGERITVKVTPADQVFIDGLKYNSKTAEQVAENEFAFEMPERDVKLEVRSSSTVTVESGAYFKKVVVDKEKAAAGETVTVTFVTIYADDFVSKVLVNDSIEAVMDTQESDIGWYVYTFKMPEGPALVKGYLENEYYVIERESDEHSDVWMLDCINNQGTPEEFCSQVEGKLVHFLYKWDIGYVADCKVIGKETGTDYTGEIFWSLASDNFLYQDCWAFAMPDEGVLISVTSREESIYPDATYTGTYAGYEMTLGENRIITSSTPSLNVELRESAAYIVTSDDYMSYDFSGLYNVTEGRIGYDPDNCRGDYALSGKVLSGDFAFFIIDDLIENKADNRRYYLAGKKGFTYACATDTESATRFLVEADCNGTKTWYFAEKDNQSIKEAAAEFKSGASIAESCEAMISIDGKPYIKYTYQTGGIPVFQYCGKESGSYASANGETLVLDGFGGATYNGEAGSYGIEANIVTFTAEDGSQIKFSINRDNGTFTVIAGNTNLKLDPVYSTNAAWIYTGSGDPYQGGTVRILFDSDFSGNFKEGYALIRITYMEYGQEEEMIGASCPYFIDEENRTVTISNVLQGTGTGWSTVKKDIVLNISEDAKTLTFVDSYIFSTSSPNIYCYGGEWAPVYSESAE